MDICTISGLFEGSEIRGIVSKNGGSPYESAYNIVIKIGTPQKRHLTFGKLPFGRMSGSIGACCDVWVGSFKIW